VLLYDSCRGGASISDWCNATQLFQLLSRLSARTCSSAGPARIAGLEPGRNGWAHMPLKSGTCAPFACRCRPADRRRLPMAAVANRYANVTKKRKFRCTFMATSRVHLSSARERTRSRFYVRSAANPNLRGWRPNTLTLLQASNRTGADVMGGKSGFGAHCSCRVSLPRASATEVAVKLRRRISSRVPDATNDSRSDKRPALVGEPLAQNGGNSLSFTLSLPSTLPSTLPLEWPSAMPRAWRDQSVAAGILLSSTLTTMGMASYSCSISGRMPRSLGKCNATVPMHRRFWFAGACAILFKITFITSGLYRQHTKLR